MHRCRRSRRAAWALALLLAARGAAHAGSFSVNPVRLTLSAPAHVGSLSVRNDGIEPAVVQVDVADWSQRSGRDVLGPTRDVLATPPLFTLPAGGSQLVRIALRRPPDPRRELAYRLLLQEVPDGRSDVQGLQMSLRVSLPVFVPAAAPARARLLWHAAREADGRLRLSVRNVGAAHARIRHVQLAAGPDRPVRVPSVAGYVLPQQRREWLVAFDGAPGVSLRLVAQTDAGEMRTDLAAGPQ